MSNVAKACILGIICTLGLLACAIAVAAIGFDRLADGLFWQHGLLLNLLRSHDPPDAMNIHMGGAQPIYILAFLASILLGFAIYGIAAYVALRLLRRST